MEIKGSEIIKPIKKPITRLNRDVKAKNKDKYLVQPSGDFGILFSESRRKKKVSIEEVSKKLCIKKHQLIAIEEERFEDLPYYTYTHSFVVMYAEYLGLKGAETAKKFEKVYPNELKVTKDSPYNLSNSSIERGGREEGKSLRFNPTLLLAFISVLALAVFLSKKVSSAEDEHNKQLPIEEGISKIEQRQGALLEGSKKIGSVVNQ